MGGSIHPLTRARSPSSTVESVTMTLLPTADRCIVGALSLLRQELVELPMIADIVVSARPARPDDGLRKNKDGRAANADREPFVDDAVQI